MCIELPYIANKLNDGQLQQTNKVPSEFDMTDNGGYESPEMTTVLRCQ